MSSSVASTPFSSASSISQTTSSLSTTTNVTQTSSAIPPFLRVSSALFIHLASFFTAESLASVYALCKALRPRSGHQVLWKHLIQLEHGYGCPRCGCEGPFDHMGDRSCFCDSCWEGCVDLHSYPPPASQIRVEPWRSVDAPCKPQKKFPELVQMWCSSCGTDVEDLHEKVHHVDYVEMRYVQRYCTLKEVSTRDPPSRQMVNSLPSDFVALYKDLKRHAMVEPSLVVLPTLW